MALLLHIAEHNGWGWGQYYYACLFTHYTHVGTRYSCSEKKGPHIGLFQAFRVPVEPGRSQQGDDVHDYDNEATQSESEGCDIDEPLGFSGSRKSAFK